MKPLKAILFISLACLNAAHGAPVLLGGYYGLNESGSALQSAAPGVSDITVALVRSGTASTDITQGFSQINSANWGNTTLDVAAPTIGNGDDLRNAIFQGAAVSAGTHVLTLTITNNGTADLLLDSMHWWVKKDINNAGPNLQSLTYTTGDLADADGLGTGTFAISNGVVGYDVALSSFLTDTTLAAGESASFTWEHGDAQDPLANTAIRMDNFAISGSVATPPDTTPPSPNPMTWASLPAPAGESSITMIATTATDDSDVQYEFTRYASDGVSVLFTSPWQASPEFTDTGLVPATEYQYTVRARDLSANNNTTDPSTPAASATTDPADVTPPSPDPITFLVAPVAVSPTSISMTAATATDPSGVQYRFIETSGNTGGTSSNWQDSPTYIDLGLSPNTEYTYTVQARDKSIAQNLTSEPLETAAATTLPAAGIGTTLVGGFHGGNEGDSPLQSASYSSSVDVTLTSTTGDVTQGFSQISSSLWGATDLDVDAPTGQTPAELAIVQLGTATPFTLTLTVTNNGTVDLPLDGLHFIVKKDFAGQGPEQFTIAYTGGDLGSPASTIVGLPDGINGFDVPLASFLGDTTLAGGESATFSWTPGTPVNLETQNAIRIDNLAISSPVAGPGGTTYAIWSGGTAANDDTNGDGVENAVAYMLGAADVNAVVTGDLPTQDNATDPDFYIFNFRRSDDAEADATTTIAVQYGNDLAGWTTAVDDATDVIITETNDFYDTGIDKVEVKLRRSVIAPGGKLFARLQVTVTP